MADGGVVVVVYVCSALFYTILFFGAVCVCVIVCVCLYVCLLACLSSCVFVYTSACVSVCLALSVRVRGVGKSVLTRSRTWVVAATTRRPNH